MSFLTVEDINGILFNYSRINHFYELNTSLILGNDDYSEIEEGYVMDEEYFDITYDFVRVTRTLGDEEYIFSFEIINDLWCGGYYFTDLEGNYLDLEATYEDGILSVTSPEENIILVLYLNNIFTEFKLERLSFKPIDTSANMFFTQINDLVQQFCKYDMEYLIDEELPWAGQLYVFDNGNWIGAGIARIQNDNVGESFNFAIPITVGNVHKNYTIFKVRLNDNTFYFTKNNIKHILPISFYIDNIDTDKFVLGKINKLFFSTSESLENYVTDINLHYKNQIIPVNFKRFTRLDLTDKSDTKDVVFKIVVGESAKIKGYEYNFKVPCGYTIANHNIHLKIEAEVGGSNIIEIGADFALIYNEEVHIKHDMIIKGNFKTLNLNNHSFIIDEGVTVIFQDLKFENGNPIFIQEKNSNLTLDNCYFSKSNASSFGGLGSVIHCNIDKNSLEDDIDFKTNLNNCIFDNINSSTSIFHGGELKVDNCKVKINSLTNSFNNKIPWFLYQTDGNAVLTSNIFDFNVETDILCENQLNIGFYQALLHCGLNAVINNASWYDLKQNNALPFFDSYYKNKSHLFVKYFCPPMGSCIFTSPEINFEDKSCCHTISDVDYVFKNNAKLTNASWSNENNLKKFSLDLSWGGD